MGQTRLLLDTHVVVWLSESRPDLGPQALATLVPARADGGLAVSAMTFWELAMLVRKNRIELDRSVATFRQNLLEFGIKEFPVDGVVAEVAGGPLDGLHGDPADRIILATALSHNATLVTADRLLLAWPGVLDRVDARA